MSALPEKRWTVEEYLDFERASDVKHEYLDGEVYAMTGASENHVLICVNVTTYLNIQVRKRPCKIYAESMRVRVSPRQYVYPDVSVMCGEAQLQDDQLDTLLNPTLIVEVLSPSTEGYDRGKKFEGYRTISSMQEYVLIAQDRPYIERYIRQLDGGWLLTAFSDMDGVVELASIGCTLALDDVYEKVTFKEA